MFAAILSILLLPVLDFNKARGLQFRPFSKIAF
jgi:ubiquinol-cytochrome c reductase cytochrome b subunit